MIELDFEQIEFEEVLAYFNISNVSRRGDELQFSCPFPEHYRGDRNPSASVNTKTGRWLCFGCGRAGNLVALVADLEEISHPLAAQWLRKSYGGGYGPNSSVLSTIETIIEPTPPKTERILPDEYLKFFEVDWRLAYEVYKEGNLPKRLRVPFEKHKLAPEILIDYSIGFDPKTKRITIPIKNEDAQLIGFKGRATSPTDKPKYLALGDKKDGKIHYGFPTINIHDYMYEICSADGEGIIVEGEFDTLSMRQRDWWGAVGLGGSSPTEKQIKQIINKFDSVCLLLDPDSAGNKAKRILERELLKYMPVTVGILEDSDPAETDTNKLEQIIAQRKSTIQIN